MSKWQPPETIEYWAVPRCFEGETVAILAGGKTLSEADARHVRGRCRVIAINRARELAPWADWLFACDPTRFWAWYPEALDFAGTKIVVRGCADMSRKTWRALDDLGRVGVKILRHSGLGFPCLPRHEGVSGDPAVVRGNNSLFQILSVIAHTGARTVLLLGADMRGGHFHSGYPVGEPNYAQSVVPPFGSLKAPIERAGVAVLNCCPSSLLDVWPKLPLRAVLP